MSLLGYGDIYCKTEWGLPEEDNFGDVYYDIATECEGNGGNGGGGGAPSDRPVLMLIWDTSTNPAGSFDYSYKDLDGNVINATLPNGTARAYVITSSDYLSDVSVSNVVGSVPELVHGGRKTYTSLTNISEASSVTPTYYAQSPANLTRTNWPSTIAPNTTWTGSLALLPRPIGASVGDTSVQDIFDDNAKTGSPVFTTQLAAAVVIP